MNFIPTGATGGAEQGGAAVTKLMATEKAGGTNGLRKGVMRCDCPGCWDCGEQNGKRPPGRGENASDCSGKSGVKDHWNGQGNLAALGLIPGLHPRGSGLGRTRTTKLSPSSALGERGCPCPAPAASQSTLGKHSSGVTQIFGWDMSPSPQGMQDASPGLCIHTAQDLLKVMDAKVSPQFSN